MPTPPDPLKAIIENIYELVSSDAYDEAERLIDCISDIENQDAILLFYKAICKYEKGNDLDCLQLLAKFLLREPTHVKRDYSVFTAAVCLANLGLEEDALDLLSTLPCEYPSLDEEKQSAVEKIDMKRKAKAIAEVIFKMYKQRDQH